LADRVAASGCLVSEFPMDAPPRAEHFPRRNRVVSGLSMGVVVVEAARRSGSLITARWAAEQGREVFAVPGPADSALSEGCHELLRDGATLVLGALEVVEALAPAMGLAPAVPCSGGAGTPPDSPRRAEIEQGRREGPEGRVWESLGSCPLTVDEVVEATGLAPAVVQSALARLDLSRVAWRGPGGTWTRAWTARPGGATRLASG
ncbi:MAG: DNA-protecting protein DprA, partial [Planctomycetes bacterium]|nr:DNA-protecting protein DprA [Planctomycetota bacterium]